MLNWDDPRHLFSLIIGLLLLPLGLIPLLSQWGVIGFALPAFMAGIVGKIALYVIAAIGLWLFIAGWMEDDGMRMITLISSIAFIALGVVALLGQFGMIGLSIPFLSLTLYNIIFVIEGLLLVIAFFAMY